MRTSQPSRASERVARWRTRRAPTTRVLRVEARAESLRPFLRDRGRTRRADDRVPHVHAVAVPVGRRARDSGPGSGHGDASRRAGTGVFTRLTLAALEELKIDTDLVFNTPNGKSLPGYLKMGWRRVMDVPIRVRVRRPVRFAHLVRSRDQEGHQRCAPRGFSSVGRRGADRRCCPPTVALRGARRPPGNRSVTRVPAMAIWRRADARLPGGVRRTSA